MRLPRRCFLHLAVADAAAPALSRAASARDYPNRPMRILVGFSAGGADGPPSRVMTPRG